MPIRFIYALVLTMAMAMRVLPVFVIIGFGTLFASTVFAEGLSCPKFQEIKLNDKISSKDRAAIFDGGVVAWVLELRIDTDGSTVSYHPENIGTTHLCNGMNPYLDGKCLGVAKKQDLKQCYDAVENAQLVGWERAKSPAFCVYGFEVNSKSWNAAKNKQLWGGAYGDGPIPAQKDSDPAPGFFISTTASPLQIKASVSRVKAYADADRIPYIVAPSSFIGRSGPTEKRAAAAIMRTSDLHVVQAIVGDSGDSLGEVSVAAVQLIADSTLMKPTPITEQQIRSKQGLPYPYRLIKGRVRAEENPSDGPYLIFAFSKRFGIANEYSQDKAKSLSIIAFEKFGGENALGRCAIRYFQGS
jgi:hypothetical protein